VAASLIEEGTCLDRINRICRIVIGEYPVYPVNPVKEPFVNFHIGKANSSNTSALEPGISDLLCQPGLSLQQGTDLASHSPDYH
jgi:hypothetical protein